MAQASLDLQNGYDTIQSKIKASRTYLEVKGDADQIIKQQRNNLEQSKQKVSTSVEKLKENQKRYQRQVKTQLDQLLGVLQFNSGAGSSTLRYIKSKFIETAVRISPKISEMLNQETISALGCSQQQAYESQTFYIKIQSVDLKKLLKQDPADDTAAILYEKTPPTPNTIPFSMNRELYDRIQNLNVPMSYYGASGQHLFDISYVQTNGIITGDFFKVDLINKSNGINKVSDFIVDYYKSIKIVDTNNLFAQLMDQICGAISFEAKIGTGELDENNKFIVLLQRILGLCFDSRQEIDVSGVAKVAELDGVDDTFFELTDMDLRYIDTIVSNIKNGVVEFEDCENVLLPLDSKSIIDSLLKFNETNTIEEEEKIAESLTDKITDNEKWKFIVPNSVDIKLSVDLSFLTSLPKAIMMALLSPKVILPLMIMSKAIQQNIADFVEGLNDMIIYFKKYITNLMSRIGGMFIEELFYIIKKDIKTLVGQILNDISKEKILKNYAMVLKMVSIILSVAQFVSDWRRCKNVVDEILNLLNLASIGIGVKIPAPLLAAAELLDGFSSTRATINVIEELQKLGLPTGPLPDGSPNLALQSELARIKGVENERVENGKVQVFIKPLTITPAGVTLPAGNIFGKSF